MSLMSIKKNVITTSICFDPGVLKKVDDRRGITPRSAYVNDVLQRYLKLKGSKK